MEWDIPGTTVRNLSKALDQLQISLQISLQMSLQISLHISLQISLQISRAFTTISHTHLTSVKLWNYFDGGATWDGEKY
jgi:hypothetical protein